VRVSSAIVSLIVTTSFWACSSAGDATTRPGGSTNTTGGTTTGGLTTGTGTLTGSGAGGTSGLMAGGDSDAASDNCGHKEFNVTRKPAEVLLVLDRSASMEDPPRAEPDRSGVWWCQG